MISRTVPPSQTIIAAVAFVVSARDHLAALQWAYHVTDPGMSGLDPTADQLLVLLPGVTRAPVPTGPLGAMTLRGVTVEAHLHAPNRQADPSQVLWVVTVSIRNQGVLPLYDGASSFTLLDDPGLFHVSAPLDPSLQPLGP